MSTEEILREQIIQKAWEDDHFKEQLLQNPKEALKESLGVAIPDDIELHFVEETPKKLYVVLPPNPAKVFSKNITVYDIW